MGATLRAMRRGNEERRQKQSPSTRSNRLIALGVSSAGVLVALLSVWLLVSHGAQHRWPTASAEIEKTERAERDTGRGGAGNYRETVTVRYHYRVESKVHMGEVIRDFGHDSGAADQMAAHFAPGSDHTVYFDPDDPSQSVLELPSLAFDVFLGVLGLAAALGGLLYCRQQH